MNRPAGDGEGPVVITRTADEVRASLDARTYEVYRAFILAGDEVPDTFETDSEWGPVDWAGVAGMVASLSRTRLGRIQLCLEHDLCPVHECDLEICEDDEDEECAAILRFLGLIVGPVAEEAGE